MPADSSSLEQTALPPGSRPLAIGASPRQASLPVGDRLAGYDLAETQLLTEHVTSDDRSHGGVLPAESVTLLPQERVRAIYEKWGLWQEGYRIEVAAPQVGKRSVHERANVSVFDASGRVVTKTTLAAIFKRDQQLAKETAVREQATVRLSARIGDLWRLDGRFQDGDRIKIVSLDGSEFAVVREVDGQEVEVLSPQKLVEYERSMGPTVRRGLVGVLDRIVKHVVHEPRRSLQLAKAVGVRRFLTSQTEAGRTVAAIWQQRSERLETKRLALEAKQAAREARQARLQRPRAFYERMLFQVGRPLTAIGAATKAAMAVTAYDVLYRNTPLYLVGKGIEKVWTTRVGDVAGYERAGRLADLSGRELAARLEEKLMIDPLTGKGLRSGAISGEQLRLAMAGGVEWAFKMKLLPYFLSKFSAVAALGLKPAEWWSLMRSSKMLGSGVGSYRQFRDSLERAESWKEKAGIALQTFIWAPLFLAAEKLCPEVLRGKVADLGGVNLVLMGDIGLMRFLGEVQKKLGGEGLTSTKLMHFLERVETGITAAFAADSAVSLGESVVSMAETGSPNPLSRVKSEKDLLALAEKEPDYLVGTGGGVFGAWRRMEHELISHLKFWEGGGQEVRETPPVTLSLTDEAGNLSWYQVSAPERGEPTILKVGPAGTAQWNGESWVNLPGAPTSPQESFGTLAESAAFQSFSTELGDEERADLRAQARETAGELAAVTREAVHDYVYFSDDGLRMAFRIDLRLDESSETYETVETKVGRLFAGDFEDEALPARLPDVTGDGRVDGRDVRALTPEQVREIAGPDYVYERQLYAELVVGLLGQAQEQGLPYHLNEVKGRFAEFLNGRLSEGGGTLEGEVVYEELFNFLFQDAVARQVEMAARVEAAEVGLPEEIVLTINSGDTVNALLQPYGVRMTPDGIRDASNTLLETTHVFKRAADGTEQLVGFDDLNLVFPGDTFVVRFGEVGPESEGAVSVPLPAVSALTDDVTAQPVVAGSDDVEVVDSQAFFRAADGSVFLGEVGSGDTISGMLSEALGATTPDWFGTMMAGHADGTIKFYRLNPDGTLGDEVFDSVSVGDRIVMVDSGVFGDAIPEGIGEVVGGEVVSDPELVAQAQDLERELTEQIAEVSPDYRVAVAVVDPNHPEFRTVINGDEVFSPGSLQKVHVAMLAYKAIEEGRLSLETESTHLTKLGGGGFTVEELLSQLIVESSNQAQDALVAELTGTDDRREQARLLDQMVVDQLGLAETTYGDDPSNGQFAETTVTDIAKVLELLSSGRFLTVEHADELLTFMGRTESNEFTLAVRALEIYEGVEVAERIAVGVSEQNNENEMHTMSVVTMPDGRELLLVVMTHGPVLGGEQSQLVRDLSQTVLAGVSPELAERTHEYSGDFAYYLANSRTARQDFVASFLRPDDVAVNPEILARVPDFSLLPLESLEREFAVQADGTIELAFTESATGRTLLFHLDSQQHILSVLDSARFVEQEVNFADLSQSSPTQSLGFVPSQFSTQEGVATVRVETLPYSYVPIASAQDRETYVADLYESGADYNYLIFEGVGEEPPTVVNLGFPLRQFPDELPRELKVGLVTVAASGPSERTQDALHLLLENFASDSNGKTVPFDGIYYSVNGETVSSGSFSEDGVETFWPADFHLRMVGEGLVDEQQRVVVERETAMTVNFELELSSQLVSLMPVSFFGSGVATTTDVLEQLGATDKERLLGEFRQIQNFIKVANIGDDVVAEEEFLANLVTKILADGTVTERGNVLASLSTFDLFNCAGVSLQSLTTDGVLYFTHLRFPEGYVPDEKRLAEELGVDEKKLYLQESAVPGRYLVGVEVLEGEVGGVDVAASFGDRSSERVLYKYYEVVEQEPEPGVPKLTRRVYHLSAEPPADMSQVDSVYPLETYSETLANVRELVAFDQKFEVSFLYADDDVYAIATPGGETVEVYYDPDHLLFYGQTTEGVIVPLYGYHPDLSQIAEHLGLTARAGEADPRQFFNRYFTRGVLDLVGDDSVSVSMTAVEEVDYLRVAKEGANDLILSPYHGGDGSFPSYFVDREGHLVFEDANSHQTYVFDSVNGFSLVGQTFSLSEFAAERGMTVLVSEEGVPVAAHGLPVFIDGSGVGYLLQPDGFVATSRDELPRLDVDVDGEPFLSAMVRGLPTTEAAEFLTPREYGQLTGNRERLLHQASLLTYSLIEGEVGLVDPTAGYVYKVAHDEASSERLVTERGEFLLEREGYPGVYYRFDEQHVPVVVGAETQVLSLEEYLKDEGLAQLELDRSSVEELVRGASGRLVTNDPAVDQLTRLPVYVDENGVCYTVDVRGKVAIGQRDGLVKAGLVGYENSEGEFVAIRPRGLSEILLSNDYSAQEKLGLLLDKYLYQETVKLTWWLQRVAAVGAWLEELPMLSGMGETLTELLSTSFGRIEAPANLTAVAAGERFAEVEAVSPWLVKAVIANEDREFFATDYPVSTYAVLRALVYAYREKAVVSGASTLWMQAAEVLLVPYEERRPEGVAKYLYKLGDFPRAALLDQKFSATEAFEIYMNSVNYGGRQPGVTSGARALFGKEPVDLTLAESVMLAVIPQAPELHNAIFPTNATAWTSRSVHLLSEMEANGFITHEQFVQAQQDVHELVEPAATTADLVFLEGQDFITQERFVQVEQLAEAYRALPMEERVSGSWMESNYQYRNFFEYLREQGAISEQEFDCLLLTYYRPQADTKEAEALLSQSFLSRAEREQIQNGLIPAYNNLTPTQLYREETDTDTGRVIPIYTDFYEFLSQQGVLTDEEVARLESQFRAEHRPVWQAKLAEAARPGSANAEAFLLRGVVVPSQPPGALFEGQAVESAERITLEAPNPFAAMVTTTTDTGETAVVSYTSMGSVDEKGNRLFLNSVDHRLYALTEFGLRRLDQEVYSLERMALTVKKANTRGWDYVPEGVDPAQIYEAANGEYYTLSDTGPEYLGRLMRVFTPDGWARYLVDVPRLEGLTVQQDAYPADSTLASVTNGYLLQGNAGFSEAAVRDNLPVTSVDPNLGIDAQSHQVNPRIVADALAEAGFQATALEIDPGGDRGGVAVFEKVIQASVDQGVPVVVWLSLDAGELRNLGTADQPLYEHFPHGDHSVLVTDVKEIDGVSYVVYLDPVQPAATPSPVMMRWDYFLAYAAPQLGSRLRALVTGEVTLPEQYAKYEYRYDDPVRQVASVWLENGRMVDWRSESELTQQMTIERGMQQYVAHLGQQFVAGSGASGFIGLAMDGAGNIIFNVNLDGNGQVAERNLAAQQDYTPGSVWKLITAAWALEHGLDPTSRIPAGDHYTLPSGDVIRNWTETGDYDFGAASAYTLPGLIAQSNNPGFFRLYYERERYLDGSAVDPDSLMDFAYQVGFGQGHTVPGLVNTGGFLGTDEWAQGHPDYQVPLDPVYHGMQAFGQSEVRVTPLEMLRYVGALANRGTIVEPNVVDGREPVVFGQLPNSPEDLDAIIEGMGLVATSGTASHRFGDIHGYTGYFKTGTAELGPDVAPHSWFVGWAENEAGDKFVFTFLFPNGGEGSDTAARFGRKAIEEYFRRLPEIERAQLLSENPELAVAGVIEVVSVGREVADFAYYEQASEGNFLALPNRATFTGPVDKPEERVFQPEGNIAAADALERELIERLQPSEESQVEVIRQEIGSEYFPEGFQNRYADYDENRLANIMVRMGDPDATQTIVLTSHYDSVSGPAASDNGWTVAMAIEALERIKETLPAGVEVVWVFTTGEEMTGRELVARDNQEFLEYRLPGARAAMDYLKDDLDVDLQRAIGFNMDTLVDLAHDEGRLRVFADPADPDNRQLAERLRAVFELQGIPVTVENELDRPWRWGDQFAMKAAGLGGYLRVMTNTEAPNERDGVADVLPAGGVREETLEHTGRIINALVAMFEHPELLGLTVEASGEIPRLSDTGDPHVPVAFTPNVRLLPESIPDTGYQKEVVFVKPEEIILHWTGHEGSPSTWTTGAVYNSLVGSRVDDRGEQFLVDAHFGVGVDGVVQLMETREGEVRRTNGSFGYPNVINIEMAGVNFTVVGGVPNVPESEINYTLDLIIELMAQYQISFEHVVGHYERDTRDVYGQETGIDRGKPDPGPEFMGYFRERLAQRLDELGYDLGQPRE